MNKLLPRLVILLILLISSVPYLWSGDYLSVPIADPVYDILEAAQLKGLIDPMPGVKPYSRTQVNAALESLWERREALSKAEQHVLTTYLEQHRRIMPWWESGSITSKSPVLRADMGLTVTGDVSYTFTDNQSYPYEGHVLFLNTYLDGSLGRFDTSRNPILSYRFSADFGIHKLDNTRHAGMPRTTTQYAAFTPYTFTKPWDSYRYHLFDVFNYQQGGIDPSYYLGFRMTPELAAEFLDGTVSLRFSRVPRNWGIGDDSIILSGQARPFLAFEVNAKIFDWMDYSVLVGSLENDGSKSEGMVYQQMLTQKHVEMRPFPWAYLAVHEGVVWPKRFELGYLNPLIFSSLYQGMNGDFDNIIGGITLGGQVPGYAQFFGTWYLDEFRPSSFADFFERVRNLFAIQAGVRTVLPGVPFGSVLVQYTKIEPFTYTHPPTEVPWLRHDAPYQSFISDQYGIASRLDPNSDELLVKVKAVPHGRIFLTGSYQLIRHGHYGGFYDMPLKAYSDGDSIMPDAMTYPDWLGGDAKSVGNLRKQFLADGDYEWYHIASVTADVNLKGMLPIPIRAGITYSYVYQFMRDHTGTVLTDYSGTLRPDFEAGNRNTITLSFQVF